MESFIPFMILAYFFFFFLSHTQSDISLGVPEGVRAFIGKCEIQEYGDSRKSSLQRFTSIEYISHFFFEGKM